MKIKFNKFERVAGFFVISAMAGALATTIFVAVKKGWFSSKVSFSTTFERAQGIYPGTHVEVAGLMAGSVDSVELQEDNRILIKFSLQEKFHSRVRSDSVVVTKRPFIIGDKALEVVVGKADEKPLAAGSLIPSQETVDLMDLMDGRKIGPYIETLGQVIENLKVVAEAFLDPKRSKNLISIFDKIDPFMEHATIAAKNFTNMSGQLTRDKNLQTTIQNLATVTGEMNNMIKEMPNMSKDMAGLVKNTSTIVAELNKVIPALAEMAPEFPRATRRAIEAIDEAVIVLKAMQKSFLLSGSAKEVKEEEEKRRKLREQEDKERIPASPERPVEVEK
jgi:phospholipid/cholesterol/gamma-HCH transport system substrate-binding protein